MKNKKGVIDYKFLIIISLAIYFLFYYQPIASVINLTGDRTKETSTSETFYITENQKVNLCELFQPYIVAGNIQNECILRHGNWICNDNYVGCYDADVDSIDCTGGAFYSAYYQCQTVGANAFCDGGNMICSY